MHCTRDILLSIHLMHYLGNVLLDKYDVCGIFDNELDSLESRLFYVQNREPCCLFLGLP